jgi:hypothetical protein
MSSFFRPHGLPNDGDMPSRYPPSASDQDLPTPRLACSSLRYKCDRPRAVNSDGTLHRFCQVHRSEHHHRGRTRSCRRRRENPYGHRTVGLLPDEWITLESGQLIALRAVPIEDIDDVLRGIDTLLAPVQSGEDNMDVYAVFID